MRFELTEKLYMSDIEYEFFTRITTMLERIVDHCHDPDMKEDASNLEDEIYRFINKYTESDIERYKEKEEGEK